jgi:ElaB/YqjD/DUF883 family membrane-anchored ribosome-binding protein
MKNNKDIARTPGELLEDLKALIADTKTLVAESVSERSSEALAALSERLGAAQERATELYDGAKKKVVAGAKCTDATIREHPYQSLAVALGVGIVVGALIARRSR